MLYQLSYTPKNKKMLVMVDHHGLEPRTDRL